MEKKSPIQIFIAYSRKDVDVLDELRTHLKILERTLDLKVWFDGLIEVGTDWERSILDNLYSADIVILIISQNFIASDYCYDKEMMEALRLHEIGSMKVIPIIAKECLWEDTPFAKLQALPQDGKPIISSAWENPNRPYLQVVSGIKDTISEILKAGKRKIGILESETEPRLIIQLIDFKYGSSGRDNQLILFNGHLQPIYVDFLYLKDQSGKFFGPTFTLKKIIPANSIIEIVSPPFRDDDTAGESWHIPQEDFHAGVIQTMNTNWTKQSLGWETEKWGNGDAVYVNALVRYLLGTKFLFASTIVWQGFSLCDGKHWR